MLSLRTAKLKLGSLLDRSVRGVQDTEVGRVIDVLVGDDGKPAALELDVGGFMGVGNRKIAVAWALFDIVKPAGTDPIRVSLTEAQVKSAPAAEENGMVTVVIGTQAPAAVPAAKPPVKKDAAPGQASPDAAPTATGATLPNTTPPLATLPNTTLPPITLAPTPPVTPPPSEPAPPHAADTGPAPAVAGGLAGDAAGVPEHPHAAPPPKTTGRGVPPRADGQP